MAYVSPPTKTSGDGFTAAEFNQNVRDNVEFLHAPPRCAVSLSANVSVPNNTDTDVLFNVEDYDTDAMHSLSANLDRVVAKTAGLYLVSAGIEFAANDAGARQVQIKVNNGDAVAIANTPSDLNNVVVRMSVAAQVLLDVNDFVTLRVFQNSGGALNLTAKLGTAPATFLRAVWLGA
jgi:hypothetical protein